MEIHRVHPKEALSSRLWKLLCVQQGVGHADILEATIEDAGRAAEDLDVETALPCHRSVHDVGVVGVEAHTMELAINLVRSAHKERVALELVDVNEKPVSGDVASAESTRYAAGEVGQGLLDVAAGVERLPATPVAVSALKCGTTKRMDLGIGLFDERRPQDIGKELRAAADGHVLIIAVPDRTSHRHKIVNLDTHPRPVLEKPCDVDGAPRIPAMEELPCKLRTQRDRL
mmetsp:Transcript_120834/g.353018  ORF Transcript_120834/g.353018 Transcript_120834/m.353018 type:complete len:230 (-) Transcript_120834:650-1339(-)